MRIPTRGRTPLLAVVAALILGPALPAAAVVPGEVPAGLEYVALGDSYSAGVGLGNPTSLPVPACEQSAKNVPHRLAESFDFALTDVSCSGATTRDIVTDSQFEGADPQLDTLGDSTDVVTVLIGGNDLGFVPITAACAAASADGPLLGTTDQNTCESYFASAGAQNPETMLESLVVPALRETYAAIAEAAPNARVFVIGYPNLFRDAAGIPDDGCFSPLGTQPSGFPIGTTDLPYLRGIEQGLNAAIETEAADAGFSYVPTFANSLGHDVCAGPDETYVNGVIVSADGDGLVTGSLHPNERGAAFLADEAETVIGAVLVADQMTAADDAEGGDANGPSAGESATASAVPLTVALIGGALLAAALATAILVARRRARPRGRP
jgi:lysophospholipase L1-like esterase